MKRLALALPLLLAACAPAAERQADICAIQALPALPGVDAFGAPPHGVERSVQKHGKIYGSAVLPGAGVAWWGFCARRAKTTEMLLIGPGAWAVTKGGPRAHGQQVTYGTCYHRRTADGWRTTACRINP